MFEVRSHSYLNKTSIIHIDRRKQFELKLMERNQQKKGESKNNLEDFDEKF